MREMKHSGVVAVCLAMAGLASPNIQADEPVHGKRLTHAMGYTQAFVDAEALCTQEMEQHDVEQNVATTPGLLGGIKPGDTDWAQARALYIDMLKTNCVIGSRLCECA